MSGVITSTSGVLTDTGTYLDKIIANTLIEVAERKKLSPDLTPYPASPRDFAAALQRDTIALIAEVKHASPSKGVLIEPFDPVDLAKTYADNGAAALSVLTDGRFFQGSLADLQAVRAAVNLPILRKDFVINAFQVAEARAVGADAVLLIVGVLDDAKLADLYAIITEHGLTALIEVHDQTELDRALRMLPAPKLIGINARDLRTFHTDLDTIRRLAANVPTSISLIAESGIHAAADVKTMADAGASAVLVGESLIVAADRPAKVRELSSVKRIK
jgi:indole-3-glycerol phosphate synthase